MATQQTLSFPRTKRSMILKTKNSLENKKMKFKIIDAEMMTHKVDSEDLENNRPANTISSLEQEVDNIHVVLHSFSPETLPGRSKQIEDIKNILCDSLEQGKSVSVYISGAPGTGKTASIKLILNEPDIIGKFKVVYVNCTGLNVGPSVLRKIITVMGGVSTGLRVERKFIDRILELINKSKKPVLLILDEIDELETKTRSILYSLFDLPRELSNGQIVFLSISNTPDLVDRILPRLHDKLSVTPVLLHFPSYTKQEIVDILSHRLNKVNTKQLVFSQPALHLLGAKVASKSGDARRALDITKRIVDNIITNGVDEGEVYKIGPQTVSLVIDALHKTTQQLNGVTNSSNSFSEDSFPVQQKLIICSVLLVLKDRKCNRKNLTLSKIYEMYKKICQKRNITVFNIDEFILTCTLIELRGIFSIVGQTRNRFSKINLEWDEKEMTNALCDKTLIADVLDCPF